MSSPAKLCNENVMQSKAEKSGGVELMKNKENFMNLKCYKI